MVNYTPKIARDSKDPLKKSDEKTVLVKDLASKSFTPLEADTPIIEAHKKMVKQNLPGCPVVDEVGCPIGFLSERDCLIRMMQIKYHNDISVKVKDLMSSECFTVKEDDPILRAVEIFSDKSFHLLPVLNSHKKVVGILTRQSVFRHVVSLQQQSW